MTKYRIDTDGTHPVYNEPPKSQQELDYRVREIRSRPNGGRNIGDYADLTKTDSHSITGSLSRIDKEDGRR